MKFDQVAYRVINGNTFEDTMRMVEAIHGLDSKGWIHDEVLALGYVSPHFHDQESVAHLAFNYSAGLEIEVIQYLSGANFHIFCNTPLSHLGMHMDNATEYWKHFLWIRDKFKLHQHVVTKQHTNEYVLSKERTYEYAIFDTQSFLGAHLKLIRRIEGSKNS